MNLKKIAVGLSGLTLLGAAVIGNVKHDMNIEAKNDSIKMENYQRALNQYSEHAKNTFKADFGLRNSQVLTKEVRDSVLSSKITAEDSMRVVNKYLKNNKYLNAKTIVDSLKAVK